MPQQGDILLYQTVDDGEINVENGVIEMTGGLETAVYLSLWGGNEDCNGLETCPFSWWGNFDEQDRSKKQISETQYLLRSLPAISNNLQRIEEAAGRDLKWLLDEKIVSSIVIAVSIPALNQIKIIINIDGNIFEFVENWKATA